MITSNLCVKKIFHTSQLSNWYGIYQQYIINYLDVEDIADELDIINSSPTHIFIDEKKQWHFENKILLFYLLYEPNYRSLFPPEINVKKSKKSSFNIYEIFRELITLIKRYKKKLRVKSLYYAIKPLLSRQDCQVLFKKNTFSQHQYCQMINISLSTFKRAH